MEQQQQQQQDPQQQGIQRRNTTKWMEQTDLILERFTKKYDKTIESQKTLRQGLKEFDKKRDKHRSDILEQKIRDTMRKYAILDGGGEKQYEEMLKLKSGFYRINNYLWMEILSYLGSGWDLFIYLSKLSRTCKKFNEILNSDLVMVQLARVIFGDEFVNLNFRYQENFRTKQFKFQCGYWAGILRSQFQEFYFCRESLNRYRKQNCQLEISLPSQRRELTQSLKFLQLTLNRIFGEKNKDSIEIYKKTIDFFLDEVNFRGIIVLTQLAQSSSQFIQQDSFDFLTNLCGIEKKAFYKFCNLFNSATFLKKIQKNLSQEQIARYLVNIEIQESYEKKNFIGNQQRIFILGNLTYNHLIYTKKTLFQNQEQPIFFDLMDNEQDKKELDILFKSNKQTKNYGFLLNRNSNQFYEITLNLVLQNKTIYAFGTLSDENSTNIEIKATLSLNYSTYLSQTYNQTHADQILASGQLQISFNQNQSESIFSNVFISYAMENIENDNDNYKRLMALYGLSDDKENLLIIKIPF